MLTLEKLNNYGADTATGLQRCVNKESLYLRLVSTVPTNAGFYDLEASISSGDLDAAFQAAHGLKGAVSNLSLTPLSEPISEMTEHLRSRDDIDYTPYLEEIRKQVGKLICLCEGE